MHRMTTTDGHTGPEMTPAQQQEGRERRGTALLIVLGVLALVSVFAAVYAAVGRGDQRLAVAVQQQRQVEEVGEIYRDWVASIIAEDRLATYDRPVPAAVLSSRAVRLREATDYPYTDWSLKSMRRVPSNAFTFGDALRFNTPGDMIEAWPTGSTDIDPRVPSDPWLAASEPSFIGPAYAGFGGLTYAWLAANKSTDFDNVASLAYLDQRDWAHITNLSPNGLFVNLWNLKRSFDAEPGFDMTNESAGTNADRADMSDYLSLLAVYNNSGVLQAVDAPGVSSNPNVPGAGGRQGVWLPGEQNPVALPFGGLVSPELYYNVPAIWSSNQRYMFFPKGSPILAPDPTVSATPETPYYPDYQYADADGDGMYDSRWFELVDSWIPGDAINLGPSSPDRRYFAAVRVIDLSGRVNLNVATDSQTPPTNVTPAGSSPAEIDVRRLLTGEDHWAMRSPGTTTIPPSRSFGISPTPGQLINTSPLSFSDLSQPLPGGDPFNTRTYRFGDNPTQSHDAPGTSTGRYAYDAIRRTLAGDSRLDPMYTNLTAPAGGSVLEAYSPFSVPPTVATNPMIDLDEFTFAGALERASQFLNAGSLDSTVTPERTAARLLKIETTGTNVIPTDFVGGVLGTSMPNSNNIRYSRSPLFDIPDLEELLTYNGLNDPAVFSRLELITSNRFNDNSPMGLGAASQAFGPMLSSRPLELDRRADALSVQQRPQGIVVRPYEYQLNVDGVTDPTAMALFALTPRTRLTTFSRAADIIERPFYDTPPAGELETFERLPLSRDSLVRSSTQPTNGDGDVDTNPAATDANEQITGVELGETPFDLRAFMESMAGDGIRRRPGSTTLPNLDDPSIGTLANTSSLGAIYKNPQALFDLYLDALTPERGEVDDNFYQRAWGNSVATTRTNTMFYGHQGPELAIRTAAHMTANTLDQYDEDSIPHVMTLVLDATERANLINATPPNSLADQYFDFAAWFADLSTDRGNDQLAVGSGERQGGRLDPGAFRVRPNVGSVFSMPNSRKIVNVYGIEPQPVLTAAAGVSIYMDALPSQGGDSELRTPTIDTDSGDWVSNTDNLLQLVAFQLTNPFDQPIALASDDVQNNAGLTNVTDHKYYIEFAGRYYKLGEFVETAATVVPTYNNVVLEPGESAVFWAIANDSLLPVAQRWGNLVSFTGGSAFDFIGAYIPRLLSPPTLGGADPKVYRVQRMQPTNVSGILEGRTVAPNRRPDAYADILNSLDMTGNTNATFDEVRLWRRLTLTDAELTTGNNVQANDQLVDRLRDPDQAVRHGSLNLASDNISGAVPRDPRFFETSATILSVGYVARSDRAVSAATGGGSGPARPGLPSGVGGGTKPDRGYLPAFMIEAPEGSRWENESFEPSFYSSGLDESMWGNGARLESGSATEPSTFVTAPSLFSVLQRTDGVVNGEPIDGTEDPREQRNSLADGVKRSPWQRSVGVDLDANLAGVDLGDDSSGLPLNPELHVNNRRFTFVEPRYATAFTGTKPLSPSVVNPNAGDPDPRLQLMRATDLLLAFGVGPVSYGDSTGAGTLPFAERYVTLPEALAFALGFYDDTDPAVIKRTRVNSDNRAPLELLVDEAKVKSAMATNAQKRKGFVLDRGHLRLDQYVSFYDNDGNTMTGRGVFDSGKGDMLTGDGTPMALEIVTRMNALRNPRGGDLLTDPPSGRINVNTMSTTVSRSLPNISPTLATDDGSTGTPVPEQWWDRLPTLDTTINQGVFGLPRLNIISAGLVPDIGPTVVAYRDKTQAIPRPDSRANTFVPSGRVETTTGMARLMNFAPWRPNVLNISTGAQPTGQLRLLNDRDDPSRLLLSGVQGHRPFPGIGSVAELATLRTTDDADLLGSLVATGTTTPATQDVDNARWNTMDALATDGDNLGAVSFDALNEAGIGSTVPGDDYAVTLDTQLYQKSSAATEPRGATNALFGSATEYEHRRLESDKIADDYDEQLAMINNLLGTTTVRSDTYAAWILVHGYDRADVETVAMDSPGQDQALTPSYAKRYLLIIDRSNVVERGQRPRIVLFREVPE